MNVDTGTALFLVLIPLAALIGLIVWLLRTITDMRLRRILTKETVVKHLCSGECFDMNALFRVFHTSIRPHQVRIDHGSYEAYMGKHDKVKLSMHRKGNMYYLDSIKSYQDRNWQFAGWYDTYDGRKDRGEREFIVIGCYDDEVKSKRRLPSFQLSRRAVEQLFEALRMSA